MREIKFRGRRSHDKEWVVGNLVIDNRGNKHIVPFSFFEEDGHHLQYNDDTDKPVFFDQETIEQFTGLHDKKNREIYHGDICKIKFDVEKVEDSVFAALSKKEIESGERIFLVESPLFNNQPELNCDDIEVIGNIHENPELLEERE